MIISNRKNNHLNIILAVVTSLAVFTSPSSFAENISLKQARSQFDKAKYHERESELYFDEAENQVLAHRAETKHQQIIEKQVVIKRSELIEKLNAANTQKEKDELNRGIVAIDKRLLSATNARLGKGYRLEREMSRRRSNIRLAQDELMRVYQILIKVMQETTPPILQSVQVIPETEAAVYDVRWNDVQDKSDGQRATENKRLALRRALANLEMVRDEASKRLEHFKRQRSYYVSDEKIALGHIKVAVGSYASFSELAVIAPAATEILGVIVEAGVSGGASLLDGTITIINKLSLAAKDEIGNKHIGTFVSNLHLALLKKLGPPKKYPVLKSSLIGDGIETTSYIGTKSGVTWLAKKYPKLGKIILQTGNISAKNFHQLMNWPDVGKGLAFSAATAAVKSAVAQYFQNQVDQDERDAFEAFFDHQVAQSYINTSIQVERPTRELYKETIAAIADTKRLLNESRPVLHRVEIANLPLRDYQLDKPVRIVLKFSRPLTLAPSVLLGSQTLSFKATAGLPGRDFVAITKIRRPKTDGEYDLTLKVALSASEKAYKKLDGDPTTAPVLHSKTNSWSFVESGRDTSHTIQIFNLQNMIREMKANAKEIRTYIIAMDSKLDFYNAKKTVEEALTAAGVGWAAKNYSGHWGQDQLAYNWQVESNSSQKFFTEHAVAMADTVDFLRRTQHINNDGIQQLRQGMNDLRQYMPLTKQAYFSCWFAHKIQQGSLWDQSHKLNNQSYDIRPFEAGEALRKQARVLSKQGDAAGETAQECFAAVRGLMAQPFFVSLEAYQRKKE